MAKMAKSLPYRPQTGVSVKRDGGPAMAARADPAA